MRPIQQIPANPESELCIFSATKQTIVQKINSPRELVCTACELGVRGRYAGAGGS